MESQTLAVLLLLAIIIAVAKAAGYVSSRLGQPAVLGDILAGLVLGPTVLNIMHWPVFDTPASHELVELLSLMGVIFLMFMAGLEAHLDEITKLGRAALFTGVLGVIVPVLLGAGVVLPLGFDWVAAVFMGLMLAATSVSISAQTLMDLDQLRSREGLTLLGAAIVDDVLVILLLSVFMAVVAPLVATAGAPSATGGGLVDVLVVLARMVLFFVVGVAIGYPLLPWLARKVDALPISQGLLSLVIVVVLVYAWAAEALGAVAAITGSFLAGVLFNRCRLRNRIEAGMNTLTYSVLMPVFFVNIGLTANAGALFQDSSTWVNNLILVLAILAVAFTSKIIAGAAGGRLGGLTWGESLRLGVGMSPRGEVLLIVATVGLGTGLVTESVFAGMIVVVLATSILTPILLRWLFARGDAGQKKEA
ncbi:MAG: cation:proton antiporter [Chloroflexi bacterium]|nr:cation:proton antiporter [Chloroflexota bacterium]MBU1750232.1 cation:proton antiporter [Chloroflexota bacterium]